MHIFLKNIRTTMSHAVVQFGEFMLGLKGFWSTYPLNIVFLAHIPFNIRSIKLALQTDKKMFAQYRLILGQRLVLKFECVMDMRSIGAVCYNTCPNICPYIHVRLPNVCLNVLAQNVLTLTNIAAINDMLITVTVCSCLGSV